MNAQSDLSTSLGAPVASYALSKSNLIQMIFFGLFFMGLGLLFLYFTIFVPASTDTTGHVVLALLGVGMIVISFGVLIPKIREADARLEIFQGGLKFRLRGIWIVTRWHEIDSFVEQADNFVRVLTRDQRVIWFARNINGAADAASKIRAATLNLMLPAARAAIDQDASLNFPLWIPARKLPEARPAPGRSASGYSIDAKAVTSHVDEQRMSWNEITDIKDVIEIQGGRYRRKVRALYVTGNRVRWRVNYEFVCNAHLLLALLRELSGR